MELRHYGSTESPVTCRSCWSGSMRSRIARSFGNWSARTNTGGIKQLDVDLVILNERPASYEQDLQASLEALVRANQARRRADGEAARGTVFVLRSELISADVRSLLQTTARVVIWSRHGSLAEQVNRLEESLSASATPPRSKSALTSEPPTPSTPQRSLEFFNGVGGFAAAGREYVTILREGQWTPAPWVNVIANPSFGFRCPRSVQGTRGR